MGRVIYHIKSILVVIPTILKNFDTFFFSVEKNRFEIFDFQFNFQ